MSGPLYFFAGYLAGGLSGVLLWVLWEILDWISGEKRPNLPEDRRERWNDVA